MQFRELFAYFLVEFYCRKTGSDKWENPTKTEIIRNLVEYYNNSKKTIITIKCLPDKDQKKPEDLEPPTEPGPKEGPDIKWPPNFPVQPTVPDPPGGGGRGGGGGVTFPIAFPIPGVSINVAEGDDSDSDDDEPPVPNLPDIPKIPNKPTVVIKEVKIDVTKYNSDDWFIKLENVPMPFDPPEQPMPPTFHLFLAQRLKVGFGHQYKTFRSLAPANHLTPEEFEVLKHNNFRPINKIECEITDHDMFNEMQFPIAVFDEINKPVRFEKQVEYYEAVDHMFVIHHGEDFPHTDGKNVPTRVPVATKKTKTLSASAQECKIFLIRDHGLAHTPPSYNGDIFLDNWDHKNKRWYPYKLVYPEDCRLHTIETQISCPQQ